MSSDFIFSTLSWSLRARFGRRSCLIRRSTLIGASRVERVCPLRHLHGLTETRIYFITLSFLAFTLALLLFLLLVLLALITLPVES